MSAVNKTIKKIINLIINIVLLFLGYAIMQIPTLAEFPYDWINETYHSMNLLQHTILFIVSIIIIFPIMYWIVKRLNPTFTLKDKLSIKNIGIATAIAILSEVLQIIISYSLRSIVHESNMDNVNALHSKVWWIFLIVTIIISPIFEEMLFQGGIQKGLFKSLNPYLAIVLTALIFAAAHGYFEFQEVYTYLYLIAGLAYGFVYQYTNDIKMAMLAHGLANVIVTLTILF